MHKNNKYENQSSHFMGQQGNGIREGYTRQFDYFYKVLFIKLGGRYTCAITTTTKCYIELTVVAKMKKVSLVKDLVPA